MNRSIKKVAILGSGVMGSRIACLFAGIGVQVLLLDIVPKDVDANAKPEQKNKLVNDALQAAIKSNPSPVYTKDVVKHITTGNFDDNMKDIASCDWIIEVVIERLDIKQQVYEKVEKYRKPGTLITTNTSGIPIHILDKGRSFDFKKHFCGTHFFNPPRYLRLLEIIPAPETSKEVIDFLIHYGDVFLGKTTVLAKDTPAFIANRIGVFALIAVINIYQKYGLTINDVDRLTGPLIGNPKSAVFRTSDLVGVDTFVEVIKGVIKNCPGDEAHDLLSVPDSMLRMIENKMLGEKSGQGFFKKVKLPVTEGSPEERKKDTEIYMLDLNTLEYLPRNKTKFASVAAAENIDDLKTRFKTLMQGNDNAADFLRNMHYALFSYVTHRIPEISEELFRLDDAIKAGFGWELGTFEKWDVLGVAKTAEAMKQSGYKVAPWVDEMLAAGNISFYKTGNSKTCYYDIASKTYKPVPSANNFIILENYKNKIIWSNSNAWLYDIGDDVVALQWNTKMNTIGSEVIQAVNKGIDIAEQKYKGLVIANSGSNFSAGANVGMIFMFAIEQEYDDLDMAIRVFQNAMMRVRYSSVPVIVAPHGLTLGGGCEMTLHADKIYAAAETYIGLVELGVGLIPGGGGTKEFVVRAADEMHEDEPETITLKNRFFTIAAAKVSTSAHEGYELGILRKGCDEVVMNPERRIGEAKNAVIEMYGQGYVQPAPRKDIKVLGRSALGALYAGINGIRRANYATEHDAHVARKLAYIMCGGDLSEPTLVSEQYLLDLEREAFLSLCGERKTLQRIESVIKKGKPVRN